MPKAKVELQIQNGEPTATVRVPPGASLGDIAKIQSSLFAQPERFGPPFNDLIRGCPTCVSGIRLEIVEERTYPVTRDIQEVFQRGTAKIEPEEAAAGEVVEIDY